MKDSQKNIPTLPEVGFYHLTTTPLDRALPKLLERSLEAGKRSVVIATTPGVIDHLNSTLWTYGRASFIPHGGDNGTVSDPHASDNPIWLTTKDENPNGATLLFLTDGALSQKMSSFERCFFLFDGNNTHELEDARSRWKDLKAQGHPLVYWKQTPSGAWEKAE